MPSKEDKRYPPNATLWPNQRMKTEGSSEYCKKKSARKMRRLSQTVAKYFKAQQQKVTVEI